MFRALNTAATGMSAQQTNIDVIAHNMANVNTAGFHKMRAQFQDLLYQTVRAPGGQTGDGGTQPTGLQIGQGTRVLATATEHSQGPTMQTGNETDLVIRGRGFFQIMRPNGEVAYTRAGNFQRDQEGRLVTADGNLVEPNITIPPEATSINVAGNGTVTVLLPGQTGAEEVGQIQIATFTNPGGLMAIGGNLYSATDASGQPITVTPGEDGSGDIQQGAYEGSNVEVVNEMIDLIASQRAYEINQRVISAADEMLRKTTER